MFKNIQKSLLIRYPLLWNTKIVPLFCVMTLLHIIFFAIGYSDGAIDFAEFNNPFGFSFDKDVVIFFSVLTSILSMIIWLVFYFKNNSFKSFYPKSKFALYKEWLIQFLASVLICGFTASYFYGKDVRGRSYFSEEEAKHRCDVIRSASLFTKGAYENSEFITVDSAGIKKQIEQDFIIFKNKKYALNSLLNKKIGSFDFFDSDNDSVRTMQLKTFLVNNQKDSVARIFRQFLTISREHRLEANINESRWMELVFDYPNFEEKYIVGNSIQDFNEDFSEFGVAEAADAQRKDSLNQYFKIIDGKEVAFNKFFVPMNQLKYGYDRVSESYERPDVDSEFLLVLLYFAIGCSILIFSFRVTSGRSWLIALVSIGLLNMAFGLFSIMSRGDIVYPILMLSSILVILGVFVFVLVRNTEKGISGILLNALLWFTPAFLPLLYAVILSIAKYYSGYYEYNNYDSRHDQFPTITMLERNFGLVFFLNIIFIFATILLLSVKIKKWKGIAEG